MIADSYMYAKPAAQGAGSADELAVTRKLATYSALGAQYDFLPVAVETLGPLNQSACELLHNLDRKINDNTCDDRSFCFELSVSKNFHFGLALELSSVECHCRAGTPT